MPNLTIRDGGREFVFQVGEDSITLGRAAANAVEIHDGLASKEHCLIQRVGNRWKLVDLESKNGTKVNGHYRNKAWLHHDDTISIGAAEVRFGLEGGARVAAPRAPAPAARAAGPRPAAARPAGPRAAHSGAAPARARAPEAEDEVDDRPPPPRRTKAGDKALIWSLAVLGVVIVMVLVWNFLGSATRDASAYNRQVIAEAEKLMARDDWEGAQRYLEAHGKPSEPGYFLVEQKIKDIQQNKARHASNRKEQEARDIVSKLGRYIKNYHRGGEIEPAAILKLVEELKTTYAGTEQAAEARRNWEGWFLGNVPQRALDRLTGGLTLQREWEAAKQRADDYRKELRFREARETVLRFLSAREAVLEADTLAEYRRLQDEYLETLGKLAASVYSGKEREARDLVKNKRYDQAIAVFKEIIEKYGIDQYVRKAQGEIVKIEEQRRADAGG